MNSNPGPWARGVSQPAFIKHLLCTRLWATGRDAHLGPWEGADGLQWGVTGLKQSSPCKDMYTPSHSQVSGIEAQPFCLGFITEACLFLNIFFLVIVSIFERLHDKNELIVAWIPVIDFRLLGVTFPAQGGSAVFF